MKKYVICRLFVAFFCTMFSLASTAQTSLTRQQVCENIDSMVSLIEQVHPDPYARLSKKSFYKEVKKTKKRLPKGEISELRAHLELSRLAALFKQGHLSVYSPWALTPANAKIFPYPLFRVEPETHRLILKRDTILGGIALKKGDEMLKINGLKSRKLVERALEYCSGELDFYRCAMLNYTFPDWLYLNMPSEVYQVEIKTKNGLKKLPLNAMPHKELKVIRAAIEKDEQAMIKEPYSYEMKNDSVMIFHFNECVMEGFQEFKDFVSKMFSRARSENVRHLIIDNRYNGGGSSGTSDEICRYLTDKPFVGIQKMIVRIGVMLKKDSQDIKKEAEENPWIAEILSKPDTLLTYIPFPEDYCQPYADSLRFTGKTYLLNSHKTFSSAIWLAFVFNHFQIGTTIGEETGGVNISSGEVRHFKLPHSELQMVLPLKIFYMIGATDDSPIHGVLPDIPVPAEEAMDAAFKLIEGK